MSKVFLPAPTGTVGINMNTGTVEPIVTITLESQPGSDSASIDYIDFYGVSWHTVWLPTHNGLGTLHDYRHGNNKRCVSLSGALECLGLGERDE